MPYIPNAPDDEESKNPAQGAIAPGGGGGTQLSPNSGLGGANGGGATPAKPNAGGQFATLQTYLNANQGQAEPLAGKITSGIGNQYSTLQGQNASTLNDINSQVASNAVPGASDVLAQEAANPVSFAGDQGNVKQFQGLLNASYGGPTSAESTSGYQNQQAAVNNAIAQGQAATTTEAGREGLLQQNEARPTTGVTALNSAILSQDPNALNKVETAYKPFSNLLTGLSTGAQGVDQNIAKTQSDVSGANAAANKQIADQTQGLQTTLQKELADAQAQTAQYNQNLQGYQTAVAANQPFDAALQGSNLLPLIGVSDPFSQTYSALNTPTQNTVATPDQLATEQALNSLGNQNINLIDPNSTVGGYAPPGATPTAPDIASLMDKIALGAYGKLPTDYQFLPTGETGQQAATGLSMAGQPNGSAPSDWGTAYKNYIAPFQSLMQQLNTIYGNKYTQPIQFNGQPIAGTYTLKS